MSTMPFLPMLGGMCPSVSGKQIGALAASVVLSYALARYLATTYLQRETAVKFPSDHVQDIQVALVGCMVITYVFGKHWGRTSYLLPLMTAIFAIVSANLRSDDPRTGAYGLGILLATFSVAVIFVTNKQPENVFPALVTFAIASVSFMASHFAASKLDGQFSRDQRTEYNPHVWLVGLMVALTFSNFEGFLASILVALGLGMFVHGASVFRLSNVFTHTGKDQ